MGIRVTFLFVVVIVSGVFNSCLNSCDRENLGLAVRDIPAQWESSRNDQNKKIAQNWLSDLQSVELKKLVKEVLKKNFNLQKMAASLEASRILHKVDKSSFLPTVSFGASTSRSKNNFGYSGGGFSHSFSARWEPDIWGKIKNDFNGQRAAKEIDEINYRSAKLSLVANTVKAWCSLITSDKQVQLAERTLRGYQKNSKIVERNYRAGAPGSRALAVLLSKNNIASAERKLNEERQARNQSARKIQLLLGEYPSGKRFVDADLPRMTRTVPVGIPASLLSRRPDLSIAQLNVYKALEVKRSARKNILPSFSLQASSAQDQLKKFLNPTDLIGSLSVSLGQQIFQGGKRRAVRLSKRKEFEAAVFFYREAVLESFREVESLLEAGRNLEERLAFVLNELNQARLAVKSAEKDYSEGVQTSSILDILESQRRLNNASSSLINMQSAKIKNRVNLYLALGGDF